MCSQGKACEPLTWPIVVRVEWDLGRSSANRVRFRHWRVVREIDQAAHLAARVGYREIGEPRPDPPVPVRIDLTVRRSRRLDDDNLWAGLKPVRDVLFKSGITPDDGPAWVECGRLTQQISREWKGREEILVVIWPRDGDGRGEGDDPGDCVPAGGPEPSGPLAPAAAVSPARPRKGAGTAGRLGGAGLPAVRGGPGDRRALRGEAAGGPGRAGAGAGPAAASAAGVGAEGGLG